MGLELRSHPRCTSFACITYPLPFGILQDAMIFHHERRLDRALYHLEGFKAERAAWRETGPHSYWTERDAERGKKVIWARVIKPPPVSLSLIAGDCIHNLRAALDNLAYELALANTEGSLPSRVADRSGFPIFHENPAEAKRPNSLERFNDMIGGIDPLAKTIIEGLQPYTRGDEFRSHPLWQLNKLESMDKHRLPHVVTLNNISALSFFDPEGIGTNEVKTLFGYFDSSAPIAEYPAFDSTGAEGNVHFTAAFDVCFSYGVPDLLVGESIVGTLEGFCRYITKEVFPPLQGFLTRH
jgi:hypothetical protein